MGGSRLFSSLSPMTCRLNAKEVGARGSLAEIRVLSLFLCGNFPLVHRPCSPGALSGWGLDSPSLGLAAFSEQSLYLLSRVDLFTGLWRVTVAMINYLEIPALPSPSLVPLAQRAGGWQMAHEHPCWLTRRRPKGKCLMGRGKGINSMAFCPVISCLFDSLVPAEPCFLGLAVQI